MINPKTGNKISEEDVRGLEALDEYLKEKRAELDILEIKAKERRKYIKEYKIANAERTFKTMLDNMPEEDFMAAVGSLVDLRDYI